MSAKQQGIQAERPENATGQELNMFTATGFFIISCSFLILELLVSRVMSAVSWYHFAFMAVSIALFGMTLGAVIVFRNRNFFSAHVHRVLAVCSILFSVSCLLLLFVIANKPVFYNLSGDWDIQYDYKNVFTVFGAITLPFICLGVCLSLIFTKFAASANRIYGINLIASALGCLLFIPFINYCEANNTFIVIAFSGLLGAFCFLKVFETSRLRVVTLALAGLTAGMLIVNLNSGFLDFHWTKGRKDAKTIYKNWNAFSYLRVFARENKVPFGWGFGLKKRDEILKMEVDQVYLDIDGIAGTTMARFDGDIAKIKFLKYDITALPHYLVRDADMLVIGVGAGRDILTGLAFEQKSVTGVEINEGILYILNILFGEFSGNLVQNPRVRFVNDEARSYVASSGRQYDLIQISLIDTFAASLAGAYALTENGLYTQEAFRTYLTHLNDDGFLSVSYWHHPNQPHNILRITGIADRALRSLNEQETRKHLVIIHKDGQYDGLGVSTILVKRGAFTGAELLKVKEFCDEMGFEIIVSPDVTKDPIFAQMSDPKDVSQLVATYPLNISTPTDDKPFFFLIEKIDMKSIVKLFTTFDFGAVAILFYLLVLMTVLTLVFIIVPLRKNMAAGGNTMLLPFSFYFSLIGLAFMFVEISQMTRLSLFLGHPIYSLAVVLFSLLLSSGVGSYVLGRIDREKAVSFYLLSFIILAVSYATITPFVLENFSRFAISVRLMIAVFMIAPLGFFMGSFLPQGIRLLDRQQGQNPIALLWGLNGAMSVVGSVLAMIFLITIGIQSTFLLGISLYAIAAVIFLRLKRCPPVPGHVPDLRQ